MYKRYDGNTGKFVLVDDEVEDVREKRKPKLEPIKREELSPSVSILQNVQEGISGITELLPKVLPDGLETEDLILLLVLYLMYKESGDRELLVIMGAMFFL